MTGIDGQRAATCFVISPIGDEGSDVRKQADTVLNYIIKPALEDFDLEAVRSDELDEPGRISEQMFELILSSNLCIAVLSGRNPNVYYELAVAQCAARPTILLIDKEEPLPFDVQDLRTVVYDACDIDGLVNQVYANNVKDQVQHLRSAGGRAESLFDRYPYGPRLAPAQSAKIASTFLRLELPAQSVQGIKDAPRDQQKQLIQEALLSDGIFVEDERTEAFFNVSFSGRPSVREVLEASPGPSTLTDWMEHEPPAWLESLIDQLRIAITNRSLDWLAWAPYENRLGQSAIPFVGHSRLLDAGGPMQFDIHFVPILPPN